VGLLGQQAVPVNDPSLDLLWGDVAASTRTLMTAVHVADLAAPLSAPTATGVFQVSYETRIGLKDEGAPEGVLRFEATREVATGRIFARGFYDTPDQVAKTAPIAAVEAFIDLDSGEVAISVPFATINAARAAAGHPVIGMGTEVSSLQFATHRWRGADRGPALSDDADSADNPTLAYRLGE
jgi:hypothetical protein